MNSKDQRKTQPEPQRGSFYKPRKLPGYAPYSEGLLGKTTLIIFLIAAWIGGLAHISTSDPETLDVREKFLDQSQLRVDLI